MIGATPFSGGEVEPVAMQLDQVLDAGPGTQDAQGLLAPTAALHHRDAVPAGVRKQWQGPARTPCHANPSGAVCRQGARGPIYSP